MKFNVPSNVKRINSSKSDHPLYEWLGGDMFNYKKLESNRETSAAHISKMRDAINRFGYMGCFVFVYTNKLTSGDNRHHLYLLDGQHRINTMVSLNKPFVFYVLTLNDAEEIISNMANLNNVGKSWVAVDYVNAFTNVASLRSDYTTLMNFSKNYSMSIIDAGSLLRSGHMRYKNGNMIKRGLFKVNYEKIAIAYAQDILDILSDNRATHRSSIFANKQFTHGYCNFRHDVGSTYNHKVFKKALFEEVVPLINSRLVAEDWTERLLDVHNKLNPTSSSKKSTSVIDI